MKKLWSILKKGAFLVFTKSSLFLYNKLKKNVRIQEQLPFIWEKFSHIPISSSLQVAGETGWVPLNQDCDQIDQISPSPLVKSPFLLLTHQPLEVCDHP